jgi:hypothetical protein
VKTYQIPKNSPNLIRSKYCVQSYFVRSSIISLNIKISTILFIKGEECKKRSEQKSLLALSYVPLACSGKKKDPTAPAIFSFPEPPRTLPRPYLLQPLLSPSSLQPARRLSNALTSFPSCGARLYRPWPPYRCSHRGGVRAHPASLSLGLVVLVHAPAWTTTSMLCSLGPCQVAPPGTSWR